MDIRCIALDLDRTTLTREGKLSPGNRAALEYAIGKGVEVVVASGRAFSTLPEELRTFPGIRYAVTSNGAAVCRLPDGKVLLRRCLPPEAAEKILTLSDEPGVTYEAFVDGIAYADREYMADPASFGASPEAIAYLRATRSCCEDIRAFLLEHAKELDSVDVICWENERMDRLRRRFEMRLPEVYITSSSRQRLEFSQMETGKHTGVAWVLHELKLLPEQLASFGDADNDAELLRMSGCGIAVANATTLCRHVADAITASNEDDGVAYGIYHILKL